MTDLDTLRPEVQEAMHRLENCLHITIDGKHFRNEDYDTIRGELLRLACNDADARIALDCEHDWQVMRERAEKAEAELADLKTKYTELDELSKNTVQCLREQDDEADRNAAELAALKNKIEKLPEWYNHPDSVAVSSSGILTGLHNKRIFLFIKDDVTSNQ